MSSAFGEEAANGGSVFLQVHLSLLCRSIFEGLSVCALTAFVEHRGSITGPQSSLVLVVGEAKASQLLDPLPSDRQLWKLLD